MSLLGKLQLGTKRTGELRELLEDEVQLTQISRNCEEVKGIHQAAEKTLVSNQNLAKSNISQKPKFTDTKLLLAEKYTELEHLRDITQVKQEQLAERNSLHFAHRLLQQKIKKSEDEPELLSQSFEEGKTTLADFLVSFLASRKLHHTRLVLVNKLQEMIRHEKKTTLRGGFPEYFSTGFSDQIQPVCNLTTTMVLPPYYHPPFLLPLGGHVNAALALQHMPLWSEDDGYRHIKRGHKWSARPVRLQPLEMQHRKHQ